MPGPTPFDPIAIIEALARYDVDYILIGGAASTLHGAPTVTTDIDVVPARDPANLQRLIECLTSLDARRVTEGTEHAEPPSVDRLRYRIEQFDSPSGGIDVIFEAKRIGGYERLSSAAETLNVAGVTLRLAALDDLIMRKQWSDREKDRVHLRALLNLKKELERQGTDTGGQDPDGTGGAPGRFEL
jgi:hypothetical protein